MSVVSGSLHQYEWECPCGQLTNTENWSRYNKQSLSLLHNVYMLLVPPQKCLIHQSLPPKLRKKIITIETITSPLHTFRVLRHSSLTFYDFFLMDQLYNFPSLNVFHEVAFNCSTPVLKMNTNPHI